MLESFWPHSGRGEIIVTCRSEIVADSPAENSIDIRVFNNREGAEALLKIAGRPVTHGDDLAAAEKISEALGGLAIGIDITARNLHSSKISTVRFLKQFESRQSLRFRPPRYGLKSNYFAKTLEDVWHTAFRKLTSESYLLLSILCFIAPDGIPRSMLTPNRPLSGHWAFLSDTNQ